MPSVAPKDMFFLLGLFPVLFIGSGCHTLRSTTSK